MKQIAHAIHLLTRSDRSILAGLLSAQVMLAFIDSISFAFLLHLMESVIPDQTPQPLRLDAAIPNFLTELHNVKSVGAIVLVLFAARLAVFGLVGAVQVRFLTNVGTRISESVYGNYLDKPFESFRLIGLPRMHRDSLFAFQFIDYSISPLLSLAREVAVIAGVLYVVFLVSPVLPLLAIGAMGFVLSLSIAGTQRFTSRLGARAKEEEVQLSSLLSDSLGAATEIKLYRRQNFFRQRFSQASRKRLSNMNLRHLIESLTPYFLETVLIFMMVSLLLSSFDNTDSGRFPLLVALGLGALRIIPAMGRVVVAFQTLSFGVSYVDTLLETAFPTTTSIPMLKSKPRSISVTGVSIRRLSFRHSDESDLLIDCLDADLKAGEMVAITGQSGRGKTTLLGLLLGFYKATSGGVWWNGRKLENHVELEAFSISYVPQIPAFLNDTVLNNLTMGEPLSSEEFAGLGKLAQEILDPQTLEIVGDQFDRKIGHNGVAISGGQRQRLAILRAIHFQPDVLILDEATNALDSFAELSTITRVRKALPNALIIAVTHSPEVSRVADKVIHLG